MVQRFGITEIGGESSIFLILASKHDSKDLPQPGIFLKLTNLGCLPVLKFLTDLCELFHELEHLRNLKMMKLVVKLRFFHAAALGS